MTNSCKSIITTFWVKGGFWFRRDNNGSIEVGRDNETFVSIDEDSWLSMITSMAMQDHIDKAKDFHKPSFGR